MFRRAESFNEDVGMWFIGHLERVEHARSVRPGAASVDQNTSSWDVLNVGADCQDVATGQV